MARKEHKKTPKVIGQTLYTDTEAVTVGSPAWFAWLAGHSTFYLEAPRASFTARCELRSGLPFWYAFRRVRKRLYKGYLGRTEDLSQERLLLVAEQLTEKAGG
jgi:hypothetical protein